jgi:hypothetical protein
MSIIHKSKEEKKREIMLKVFIITQNRVKENKVNL